MALALNNLKRVGMPLNKRNQNIFLFTFTTLTSSNIFYLVNSIFLTCYSYDISLISLVPLLKHILFFLSFQLFQFLHQSFCDFCSMMCSHHSNIFAVFLFLLCTIIKTYSFFSFISTFSISSSIVLWFLFNDVLTSLKHFCSIFVPPLYHY